jgi:hypothetical protein
MIPCERNDPHDSHDGCKGRMKWAKGFVPKAQQSEENVPSDLKSLIEQLKKEIDETQAVISFLERRGAGT